MNDYILICLPHSFLLLSIFLTLHLISFLYFMSSIECPLTIVFKLEIFKHPFMLHTSMLNCFFFSSFLFSFLRRFPTAFLALGWIFSNQYFAWKACFDFRHTIRPFQLLIKLYVFVGEMLVAWKLAFHAVVFRGLA